MNSVSEPAISWSSFETACLTSLGQSMAQMKATITTESKASLQLPKIHTLKTMMNSSLTDKMMSRQVQKMRNLTCGPSPWLMINLAWTLLWSPRHMHLRPPSDGVYWTNIRKQLTMTWLIITRKSKTLKSSLSQVMIIMISKSKVIICWTLTRKAFLTRISMIISRISLLVTMINKQPSLKSKIKRIHLTFWKIQLQIIPNFPRKSPRLSQIAFWASLQIRKLLSFPAASTSLCLNWVWMLQQKQPDHVWKTTSLPWRLLFQAEAMNLQPRQLKVLQKVVWQAS